MEEILAKLGIEEAILESLKELRTVALDLSNPQSIDKLAELPGGDAIEKFLATSGNDISRHLVGFERVMPEGYHFMPRLLLYGRRANMGNKWVGPLVEHGGSVSVGDNTESMRAIIMEMADRMEFEDWIVVWLVWDRERLPPMAMLHHSSGTEVVMLAGRPDQPWGLLPIDKTRVELLLKVMRGMDPQSPAMWHGLVSDYINNLDKNRRRNVHELLKSHGLERGAVDALWLGLLKEFFLHQEFLDVLHRASRAVARRPMQEAHILLKTMVESVERAFEVSQEEVKQMERERERERKRAAKEHDMLKLQLKGVYARAARQSQEIHELKTKVRNNQATASGVDHDQSLEQTLDRLFE